MTAFTSVRDEPGRNLRNLGEPGEPLRRRVGDGSARPWRRGSGGPSHLYEDHVELVQVAGPVPIGAGGLRTAAGAALEGGRLSEENAYGAEDRSSDGDGGIRRKSRGDVCRHNGLFVAIATVGETWDGIR